MFFTNRISVELNQLLFSFSETNELVTFICTEYELTSQFNSGLVFCSSFYVFHKEVLLSSFSPN